MKLFVLDDHGVIRDGIRMQASGSNDVHVVGEAASVREAVEGIERERPNVVLLDLNLPDGSGRDLLRIARERWPEIRMVVLTVEHDEDDILQALHLGASGFITKERHLGDILDVIRRVAAGETVVEGMQTEQLLERFISFARDAERSVRVAGELSPRERQVLSLLAQGKTNQQIGSRLGISARTAATHVASIYRKLTVTNRVDAAREAQRLNLASDPEP